MTATTVIMAAATPICMGLDQAPILASAGNRANNSADWLIDGLYYCNHSGAERASSGKLARCTCGTTIIRETGLLPVWNNKQATKNTAFGCYLALMRCAPGRY